MSSAALFLFLLHVQHGLASVARRLGSGLDEILTKAHANRLTTVLIKQLLYPICHPAFLMAESDQAAPSGHSTNLANLPDEILLQIAACMHIPRDGQVQHGHTGDSFTEK